METARTRTLGPSQGQVRFSAPSPSPAALDYTSLADAATTSLRHTRIALKPQWWPAPPRRGSPRPWGSRLQGEPRRSQCGRDVLYTDSMGENKYHSGGLVVRLVSGQKVATPGLSRWREGRWSPECPFKGALPFVHTRPSSVRREILTHHASVSTVSATVGLGSLLDRDARD